MLQVHHCNLKEKFLCNASISLSLGLPHWQKMTVYHVQYQNTKNNAKISILVAVTVNNRQAKTIIQTEHQGKWKEGINMEPGDNPSLYQESRSQSDIRKRL